MPEQLRKALEIQAGLTEPNKDISEKEKMGFDGYAGAVTGQLASTLGSNCGMSTGRNGVIEPVICLNDHGGERMDIETEMTPTLRASMGSHPPLVSSALVMASTKPNAEILDGVSPTVTASAGMGGGNAPILCDNIQIYENNAQDCRYNGPLEIAPTITASYGTGGTNTSLCLTPTAYSLDSKESNSMKSANPHSGCRETEQSRTLDTGSTCPSKNQGGLAIVQPQESYCIAGNIINREDKNGGNGLGCQSEISYTLTATDRHSVYSPSMYQDVVGTLMHRDHKGVNTCYVNQDKCIVQPYQESVGAICATDNKGPNNQYVSSDKCIVQASPIDGEEQQVFGQASYGGYGDEVSTLTASGGYLGGGSENLSVSKNLVRRLTPLECERLQGFPDGWTDIPSASDSARYKALGNSVAVPCVEFIMSGIANYLRKESEERE